jgi:thiamine transport system permease protein
VVAVMARGRRLLDLIGLFPVAVSAVVVGLGILVAYDRQPFDLRSSAWLVPLVHASIAVPFACRSVSSRRAAIPSRVFEAAATLGASPWRRFTKVEIPLLRPAIATSAAVSAAVSLGEFGATSLVSRTGEPTLPLAVARLLSKPGAIPHAAAMSTATVLLALTIAIVLTLDRSLAS